MMTQDQIEDLLEKVQELQEEAAKVASRLTELNDIDRKGMQVNSDEITIEDQNLYASVDEYIGCGEWEDRHIHIPTEYLFNPEWEEKAKKVITEKRLKAQKEKEAREKAAEERAKKARYIQYLNLMTEFGDD